jgi:hypothetical protein
MLVLSLTYCTHQHDTIVSKKTQAKQERNQATQSYLISLATNQMQSRGRRANT